MSERATIDQELREELSAYMDGELDADRARFLQQRLLHDPELRALWERWQLLSSAVRRQGQPLPAGFAQRVSKALDAEVPPVSTWRTHGLRWAGGAALAASLVLATVFVFDVGHGTQPETPQIVSTHAAILPIQRTVLALPDPVIKLPLPVESGVVTAFHSPLRPILTREEPRRPNFAPFPQPYAIDPELAAYLQSQKNGATHDVFTQGPSNSNAVRTVAWPQEQQR